jgi:hypothetical protein
VPFLNGIRNMVVRDQAGTVLEGEPIKDGCQEEKTDALGKQHWNKGPRFKGAAASRKLGGIKQARQKNFQTGSHEAISQVFHQAAENE